MRRPELFADLIRGMMDNGDRVISLDRREKVRLAEALDMPYTMQEKVRALTKAIDHALADTPVIHTNTHTEHIIPRNPPLNSEWISLFPNDDIRERLTHSIGNFGLWSGAKNQSAQTATFAEKKAKLFGEGKITTLPIMENLRHLTQFTEKEHAERQREFIDVLIKEWRMDRF